VWHIYWLMEHKIRLMELAKCSDMLASPWVFKRHAIYIIIYISTLLCLHRTHPCGGQKKRHHEVETFSPSIIYLIQLLANTLSFKSLQIQKAETSLKQDVCAFMWHELEGLTRIALIHSSFSTAIHETQIDSADNIGDNCWQLQELCTVNQQNRSVSIMNPFYDVMAVQTQ